MGGEKNCAEGSWESQGEHQRKAIVASLGHEDGRGRVLRIEGVAGPKDGCFGDARLGWRPQEALWASGTALLVHLLCPLSRGNAPTSA